MTPLPLQLVRANRPAITVPGAHLCLGFARNRPEEFFYFHARETHDQQLRLVDPTHYLLLPVGALGELIPLRSAARFFAHWQTEHPVWVPMADYAEELPRLVNLLSKPGIEPVIDRSLKLTTGAAVLLIVRQLVASMPFSARQHPQRLVARFVELVERHYVRETRLGFYATQLGTSEEYLGECCRNDLSQGPKDIIQQRRLQEAKRLLTVTTLSIKEIAYTLHFEDPNYFSRFFRQQVGRTPAAYRMEED